MNSSARKCNECTLCCRLLPVAEIGKGAGEKCAQQRAKGCRVYGSKAFPNGCKVWTCLWLADESLQLPRPDRAGYVIDTAPDFVVIEGYTVSVIQIWVDPRSPDAHRDPALRAWLAQRWETHRQLALVRYDSQRATALLPPGVVTDGWYEQAGNGRPQHSPEAIGQALARRMLSWRA